MSPNKNQLRVPCGKNVSASEEARKPEEGFLSKSKPKVPKVESDEEDSNFECYDKSECKPVHVDVDKEIARSSHKDPTLALILNSSEEGELNNNGETGLGMIILAYALLSEHLTHRNGWVVYHTSEPNVMYNLFAGPTRREPPIPKPRLMTMEEIDLDYDPMEDK